MVIIVGGGPAGIMAAINAATLSDEVVLLEKNSSLGKKLLLTGNGRCNLTNIPRDSEKLTEHFSKTGKFLRDAFKVFDNKALISFFVKRGLNVKTEEKGRVFPITNSASSVLNVLVKELHSLDVKVLFGKKVKKILLENDTAVGAICEDGSVIKSGKIILATGGVSYKTTGSTGEGIKIAEKIGHRITPLRPGLVSLELDIKGLKNLEGTSLDNVKLIFRAKKVKKVSRIGDLVFTKTGISGPIVLSSSARVVDWIEEGEKVTVEIDIMPERSDKEVDNALLREIAGSPGKSVRNVLKKIVPVRLADFFLSIAGVYPEKKANQITIKERTRLAAIFKGVKINVLKNVSFEKAQVTRGGVSTKDIDPRTMESKKIKGLYFAGEMIDVDGECGGFNLQAAFSTGYLAGQAVNSMIK